MINEHIRRFEDSFHHINDRDWDAYRATISEALLYRVPGSKGIETGRETSVRMLTAMAIAFPDSRVDVERRFGQGDWGCFQATFAGTHTGPLEIGDQTIPPTGRPVQFRYCLVARFGFSGAAVEIDEYYDRLDLLTQLGVGTGVRIGHGQGGLAGTPATESRSDAFPAGEEVT
jgi:predicted ester cyclase